MRKLLIFLCLCSPAWATTTITGNLKTLGTGTISLGTFVRFYLRGCSGNQPRINGTALIAPTLGNVYFADMVPNSSGAISGTLYSTTDATGTGNGDIECGGLKTGLWYGMQPFFNGKAGPETPFAAKNAATLDISNVTPLTANPVVVSPTGDTTYMRLDGGNSPATGSWTFNAGLICTSFEHIQCVDSSFTRGGTDVGNEINLAYAALPSTGGTIFVGPMQVSFSTPIVFGTSGKPACLVGSGVPSTVLTFTPATGTVVSYSPVNAGGCFEHLTLNTSTSTTSIGVQANYVNEFFALDFKIHGFFGGFRVTGDGSANYSSGVRLDQFLIDFGNCATGGYGIQADHVNDLIITGMRNYLTGGGSGNCNLTNGVILDQGVGGVLNMAGTIEGGLHSVLVQKTALGGNYGSIPASIFPHDLFMDTPSGGAALLLDSTLSTTPVRWHCVGCWVAVSGQSSLGVITVGTAPGIDIEGGSDVEFSGGVCRANAAECAKVNSTGTGFTFHDMMVYDNNQNNGAGIAAFNITANPTNWSVVSNPVCGNGIEAGGHSQYCVDYHLSTGGTGQAFGNGTKSLGTGPYNFSGSTMQPLSATQFVVNDTFPAAAGAIRLAEANNKICVKNHAVSGDVCIIQKDTADDITTLGDTAGVKFPTSAPILPGSAGGNDIGTTLLPFGNLWLGTAATNNFKLQPAATAAARVVSIPDPLAATNLGLNFNATNGFYQSKRAVAGCTTGAAAGNSCGTDITVTWGTAFADANYSVTCTGSTPTNVPSAPFVVSASKLAATVHINYFAITAAAASYATIDCIAVHD